MRDRANAKKKECECEIQRNWDTIQRLETDLIRAKQDLAEALNIMREFEAEHTEYCGVFERKMTFKEVDMSFSSNKNY